jgi:hypothetical protein
MPFRGLNMLKLQKACCRLIGSLFLVPAFHLGAASGFLPDGGESPLVGSLGADQTAPAIAISGEGGFIVWQDSSGNGDGSGIRARRINRNLVGSLQPFWINTKTNGIHEVPQVALLADGGAVFVWRGGPLSKQGIFARFLKSGSSSTPVFFGEEVEVAPAGTVQNTSPSVVRLSDNSVVIAWSSYGSDGSLFGVQLQRFSGSGEKLGSQIQANITTAYNQRSSTLAALASGGFAVAWISENQRFENSADVYARTFSAAGSPLTGEMRLNTGTNVCASPSLVGLPTGGFVAAWSEFDMAVPHNDWDVYARAFDDSVVATQPSARLNYYQPYSQVAPRLSLAGDVIFAVWTSLNQDGYREGVYGRYLSFTAEPVEDEFCLNQTVISQQKDPVVVSDGTSRFLTAWTSFKSMSSGFDLVSRKFARPASVAAVKCSIAKVLDASGKVSGITLSWPNASGATYQVQRSDNMSSWEVSSATQTVSGTTSSITLPISQSGGFFRIISLP